MICISRFYWVIIAGCFSLCGSVWALDVTVGVESNLYLEEKFHDKSESFTYFLNLKGETYLDDYQRIGAEVDLYDDDIGRLRRKVNVAELKWSYYANAWEINAGIDTVFWGVLESENLVDVINQRDYIRDSDGDFKLGQPLVNFRYIGNLGTFDLYVIPYFIPRSFANTDQLLSLPIPIDDNDPVYESNAEDRRVDGAIRYFNSFGDLDVGLSHFSGTSRTPQLLLDSSGGPGALKFVPFYQVIEQTGVDLQYILGDVAYKFETIYQNSSSESHFLMGLGLEYPFFGVFDSKVDINLFFEYLFDDRGDDADGVLEHDYVAALRFNWNDEYSTVTTLKTVYDDNSNESVIVLEHSQRIDKDFFLQIDCHIYSSDDVDVDTVPGLISSLSNRSQKLRYFNRHDYLTLGIE